MKLWLFLIFVPVLAWPQSSFEVSGQTRSFMLTAGAKAEWNHAITPLDQNNVDLEKDSNSILAKPNPFNPTVTLSWTLLPGQKTALSIYDISGRVVFRMAKTSVSSVVWNAGHQPSGFYAAILTLGHQKLTRRITLMK